MSNKSFSSLLGWRSEDQKEVTHHIGVDWTDSLTELNYYYKILAKINIKVTRVLFKLKLINQSYKLFNLMTSQLNFKNKS